MKIFSTHRKKLEPKRRFGGMEFRRKIKDASNYKRVFNPNPSGWFSKFFGKPGLASKFWLGSAAVLFIVLFYYLCISSKFVVSQVAVFGNSQVSTQQIQDEIANAGQSRLFLIKKNDFFLLTFGRVNQLLTHDIPTIKDVVSLQKIWPHQIKITVEERQPGFVIESNGKYFLVDDEGTVVSQVGDNNNLLLVQDQATEDFAAGEVLPSSKLAAFVLSMNKQWNSKVAIPIAEVKFTDKQSTDVEFDSQEGWSVLFDTTRSAISQLDNLSALLNKEISAHDRPNLAYIDLRLSKWAYYCFKATPCNQEPQQQDVSGTTTTNVK